MGNRFRFFLTLSNKTLSIFKLYVKMTYAASNVLFFAKQNLKGINMVCDICGKTGVRQRYILRGLEARL